MKRPAAPSGLGEARELHFFFRGRAATLGYLARNWKRTAAAISIHFRKRGPGVSARGPLISAACKALGMGCPGTRLAIVRRYPRFRMIDCKRPTPERRTRSRMH